MKTSDRFRHRNVKSCTLAVALMIVGMGTAVRGFFEGWENAPEGTFTPIDVPAPIDAAFIHGDEGWWNLNDSIAGNPECEPTPNRGTILMWQGSKALRLYSGVTDSNCSDNVWVALRDFGSGYNTGFAIPLDTDTVISFDETGGLFDPSPELQLIFPPWFDNVSLQLADNRDNLLIYVFQRHPGAEPDSDVPGYGTYFYEVFLDSGGGSFKRNLFADFSKMSNFNPVGAQIEYIEFSIDEHGWAILDNLSITDVGGPALDIEWIAITSAKDFIDGVAGATPWFFEIWVGFVNQGTLHHIDVTKPSGSMPFATIYSDGDGYWDYDSPQEYSSLNALRSDYPLGTYTFEFRDASNDLLRTVQLDYSGLPGEPAGPVDFTFPSTDGQTGVTLNPTLTWTVGSSDGDALMMVLEDDTDSYDVVFEHPIDMATASWTVGPLQGNHEYEAAVSVCSVKDWVGPGWPVMTVGTDSFNYSLMIEYVNVICFETANHASVYRFWSPGGVRHFYTANVAEKEKLLGLYSDVWTYEGVAYSALADATGLGSSPIYRFWSPTLETHFYTISETERDKLINNYSHVWTYEGPGFYAYPAGQQPAETDPVYRFWSAKNYRHFYTMSESEKQKLIDYYSHVWAYEGIAWYAYE